MSDARQKSEPGTPAREPKFQILRLLERVCRADSAGTDTDMTEASVAANAAPGRVSSEVPGVIPKRRARRLADPIRTAPIDDHPDLDAAKKVLVRHRRGLWRARCAAARGDA